MCYVLDTLIWQYIILCTFKKSNDMHVRVSLSLFLYVPIYSSIVTSLRTAMNIIIPLPVNRQLVAATNYNSSLESL